MSSVVKERIPNANIRCYSIDIFVRLAGTTRYPYILISHRAALGAELPLRKKNYKAAPSGSKFASHHFLKSTFYSTLWCMLIGIWKRKQSSIGTIIFFRLFQFYVFPNVFGPETSIPCPWKVRHRTVSKDIGESNVSETKNGIWLVLHALRISNGSNNKDHFDIVAELLANEPSNVNICISSKIQSPPTKCYRKPQRAQIRYFAIWFFTISI